MTIREESLKMHYEWGGKLDLLRADCLKLLLELLKLNDLIL